MGLTTWLTACAPTPSPEVTHDAYIWQHTWRAPLTAALTDSASVVHAWHVLGGELNAQGHMQTILVDFNALSSTQRPVVLVIRIKGAVLPANATEPMLSLIHDWQRALPLAGVEVDFDSGARRLGEYSDFLRDLRVAISLQLPLTITMLPDWMDRPEFPRLLA